MCAHDSVLLLLFVFFVFFFFKQKTAYEMRISDWSSDAGSSDLGTDLYWARSRVLEYLSQEQSRLPAGAKPALGPDATCVGWIYQYALVDRTGKHDLSQLRSMQDWFLRYELKTLPNVAEVAPIGGMVKQYQVVLDPVRMASRGVTQQQIAKAIDEANRATGGSVLELAEIEFMVRR